MCSSPVSEKANTNTAVCYSDQNMCFIFGRLKVRPQSICPRTNKSMTPDECGRLCCLDQPTRFWAPSLRRAGLCPGKRRKPVKELLLFLYQAADTQTCILHRVSPVACRKFYLEMHDGGMLLISWYLHINFIRYLTSIFKQSPDLKPQTSEQERFCLWDPERAGASNQLNKRHVSVWIIVFSLKCSLFSAFSSDLSPYSHR